MQAMVCGSFGHQNLKKMISKAIAIQSSIHLLIAKWTLKERKIAAI